MMTAKTLQDLRTLILNSNYKGLTPKETEHALHSVELELQAARIIEFKEFIDRAMPTDDDDVKLERFYDTGWSIQFGTRVLSLGNCATVYNHITELLQDIIDNDL